MLRNAENENGVGKMSDENVTSEFGFTCIKMFETRRKMLESNQYRKMMDLKFAYEQAKEALLRSDEYINFIGCETNTRITCPHNAKFCMEGFGKVSFVKGYEKTSYDTEILKELEKTIPAITQAKKIIVIANTCRITYDEKIEF